MTTGYVPRTEFCGCDTSWANAGKRPANANHGQVGYNEATTQLEIYDAIAGAWRTVASNLVGTAWFANSATGADTNVGTSAATAFKTITAAVAAATAGDTIYITGSFTEAVTVTKIGLSIIGAGTGPHQATWTAAADAVCLTLNASDCQVANIRFRPPAYSSGAPAAIVLNNAPYARIVGNRFQGQTGSNFAIFCMLGAAYSSDDVLIAGNEFIYLNNITTVYGSAIESTAADGGYSCSSWQIVNNIFDAPVEGVNINGRGCLIAGNIFRDKGLLAAGTMGTVTGSAGSKLMIDLSGTNADCNCVVGNWLGGAYSSTLYLKGGSNDEWYGNFTVSTTATLTNGAGMTLTPTT